jgi:uncharacterized protein YkwD
MLRVVPLRQAPAPSLGAGSLCGLIVLVAAACALIAPPAASAASSSCTSAAGWGAVRPALATDVVRLVNAHRAGMGLPALATSPILSRSAEWKSGYMQASGVFTHDDPAPFERTVAGRLGDCGYAGAAWGENIAFGFEDAGAVVKGWLDSPGHRRNIESAAFSATGVGVVSAPGKATYWTQDFGEAGSDVLAASQGAAALRPAQLRDSALAPTGTRAAAAPAPRVARLTRGGLVRANRTRLIRFAVTAPSALAVAVRVRNRSGAPTVRVAFACGDERLGWRTATRTRPAVLRLARVATGTCALRVRAGRQAVRVTAAVTAVS